MNVFRSRSVLRRLAHATPWAAIALLSGDAALGGESVGQRWDREVRLPDSYLPGGFIRDKSSSSSRDIFSADGGGNENTTYSINTTAWISNHELSPRPGEENCPFGPGLFKELRPIRFGEAQGYWSVQGIQSAYLDVNCIFKSGPLVGCLFLHSKATHWNGRRPTVPRPSEEQVLDTLRKFVEAYSRYVRDQKWMTESGVPATQRTADEARQHQRPDAAADESIPDGLGRDSEAVSALALGSVAVGAMTALGAGLMMMGAGVTPREVIEGARELFGGGGSPGAATRVEPLSEEQRAVAARIFSEGWESVSPEEQRLLASSPGWLREAIRARLPAETIAGYEPGWKEKTAAVVTPALMVAQSGCDLAIGVTSTTMPGFGMAYTMFKNIAGGVSEGVHDWWWESNDRGLVRNVAEGFTRGGLKGGVEIAVDATVGRLMGPAGARRALDPNNIGWKEFPWADALSEVAPEYFAGQACKYGVGRAGDALVEVTDPVGSKHRPLRSEGFFDTTSPVEKAAIDLVLSPETWPAASGPPASRLPYMAQNLVQ